MNFNEWQARLRPSGVLLLCYFAVPAFTRWLMGGSDAFYGGLSFSLIIQAGLGISFVRGLFELKRELNAELSARLEKYSQPPEKTREFAGKLLGAAGYLAVLAVAWPPFGEMLGAGRPRALIRTAALVYAVYLGYALWKLARPFLAAVPAAPPPEDPEGPTPPAAAARRCPNCGQLLTDSAAACSFCKHPL